MLPRSGSGKKRRCRNATEKRQCFLAAGCPAGNPELKNKEDQFGRTPLMYCVLADRLDCAEALLKAGVGINKADHSQRTALHLAAQKDLLEQTPVPSQMSIEVSGSFNGHRERQTRARHCSSSPVQPPVQPKGRRSRSPHRRPAPPKAPSVNKSGKAAVPALTLVVPEAQAPPSPDLSELSADNGLEGITDQPAMPGTFESAKDLIKLSAASPHPHRENPPAPMPWVPSRGKPAMVCRPRTPSWHRSWSWSQSSSDSADSQLPAAWKEVVAPGVGRHEEAPERAHRSPAPPRDWHREELRLPLSEDSRRQSWSRERRYPSRSRSWSQGYRYRSRSARSCLFSCQRT
ncbi:Inversin [Chelonia mydas]|uniref:Inversin n=1 Tax=Chelonia mydas TaxID=8469 RepID=M7BEC8_CHEMY|nr:Inversin [Chelonia mydas]